MFILDIDEKSQTPLFRQVIDRIRALIEAGTLGVGERLPSTRRLAEQLGLHRSTVATAYQELWSLGYVEMRPGSRPRVRQRLRLAAAADRKSRGVLDWERLSSAPAKVILEQFRRGPSEMDAAVQPGKINMAGLNIDKRILPHDQFRACLGRAFKTHGADLLTYGSSFGFQPLREMIAQRMNAHGVEATADEILITNGMMHGIDLVLRLFAAPGRSVVVESPTFMQVVPLLRFYGFRVLEVPMRSGGMDLDALAALFDRERPALVYTMPTVHNPTGISTDQAHRERLLSLCWRARVPILEDGFEEEMKYFGKVGLPLKSMDRDRIVIYGGTFSKVLFPGLRLGWITADRGCIERLAALRRSGEITANMILQAGLHEFCRWGYYDLHVQRMHRIFRKRMQTALRLLKRLIPPEWAEWQEPNGGYLIWLRLKQPRGRTPDWSHLFADHGVIVLSGRHFFVSGEDRSHIRLSLSTLDEDEIAEGIRRVAKALASLRRPKSDSRRHS